MGALGSKHVENFKTADQVLTGILEDDYGKYLEYYPPVYVVKRCFEILRPYFLEIPDKSNVTSKINGSVPEKKSSKPSDGAATGRGNDPIKQRYYDQSAKKDEHKRNGQNIPIINKNEQNIETPPTQSKFSMFRMNGFGLRKKETPVDNGFDVSAESTVSLQNGKVELVKKENISSSSNLRAIHDETKFVSAETLFYPNEGSDIDEDDESDTEGGYTFNHDVDSLDLDEDQVSMKSAVSMKSVKSACDEEKKELQLKLMENYVNDSTKQKYKKTNSLKRIFSMKGKKKES